jgi:hypothetical protein
LIASSRSSSTSLISYVELILNLAIYINEEFG